MSRNLIHHWRLQRSIDRAGDGAQPPEDVGLAATSDDAGYRARIRAIERRLQREAPLTARTPSATLRGRTMNAIYDIEFHRRYRRQPWWKTAAGGSALAAACVLVASILFALMTDQNARARSSPPLAVAPVEMEPSSSDATAAELDGTFDFAAESLELAALAAPEWVLQAIAGDSIRHELSAIADEAIRAADYFVSRFAAGREAPKARGLTHPVEGDVPPPPRADR